MFRDVIVDSNRCVQVYNVLGRGDFRFTKLNCLIGIEQPYLYPELKRLPITKFLSKVAKAITDVLK